MKMGAISVVAAGVRKNLEQNRDPAVAAGSRRFFKEKITVYGVRTATVGRIAAKHMKQLKGRSKEEVLSLCEELFESDYNEEAWIASEWAYRMRKHYHPDDFHIFERWIADYINNWAKCDTFCSHAVGELVVQYPECIAGIKEWTASPNLWFRRAAAVTFIVPAKRGEFLSDIFDIADRLLQDPEDLVQKGYGWMLKVACQAHLEEVFEYVMRNRLKMPRTALRYAIEKMPPSLRSEAMKKTG